MPETTQGVVGLHQVGRGDSQVVKLGDQHRRHEDKPESQPSVRPIDESGGDGNRQGGHRNAEPL